MLGYLDGHLSSGGKASNVLRHLVNSVSGLPGAKVFRSVISDGMNSQINSLELLISAMSYVDFIGQTGENKGNDIE